MHIHIDGEHEDGLDNVTDEIDQREEYLRSFPTYGQRFRPIVDFSKVKAYTPSRTEQDERVGYMTRYFTRPVNNKFAAITEISHPTFTYLRDGNISFFAILSIRWSVFDLAGGTSNSTRLSTDLTGDEGASNTVPSTSDAGRLKVSGTNLAVLALSESKLPGIKARLPDPLEFYTE